MEMVANESVSQLSRSCKMVAVKSETEQRARPPKFRPYSTTFSPVKFGIFQNFSSIFRIFQNFSFNFRSFQNVKSTCCY
nr:MAG TPA: hypothetical protein [Caudoviricetes sp.]